MSKVIWVYMTAPDRATAERIGRRLVADRLAACVNMWAGMISLYRWEGEVQEAAETVVVAKTTAARYAELEAAVLQEHPYECPCIVALPVHAGHAPFLDWVAAQAVDA